MNKHKFPGVLYLKWAGEGDVVAPSCVVTANASEITATPFTTTITFSEDVLNFAIGDITAKQNGAAAAIVSAFTAVSGKIYTATITPTEAGTITVEIAAGVCVDGAGNANTASNIFSIVFGVFMAAFPTWDISKLYTDEALTTGATTTDQVVRGIRDWAGNNLKLTAGASAGLLLKLDSLGNGSNVIGLLGAGGDDGYGIYNLAGTSVEITGGNAWTAIVTVKFSGAAGSTTHMYAGNSGANRYLWQANVDRMGFTGNNIVTPSIAINNPHIVILQYNGTYVRARYDNNPTWYQLVKGTYVAQINVLWTGRQSVSYGLTGLGYDQFWMAGTPSDTLLNLYRDAINAKRNNVFF